MFISPIFGRLAAAIALVGIIGAAGVLSLRTLGAADHLDPPLRTDPNADTNPDKAADIADIYLFQTTNNLVMAVTFGGPQATTLPASYDPDLVYTLQVSNDGDPLTTEFPIQIRFGLDANGNAGVRVTGLPGAVTIEGPVETDLSANGITVRAGLFDDPFFFDSQGFRETRSSGDLAFNNQRDFFGSQNITAVVVEIPLDQVRDGNKLIDLWSEAFRFGGQI
jgi:hypothetical protein